jgi:hypothetical protein
MQPERGTVSHVTDLAIAPPPQDQKPWRQTRGLHLRRLAHFTPPLERQQTSGRHLDI